MSVPTIVYINPGNTQTILIKGLKDKVSGQHLNAALITATLYDQYGNPDPIFRDIAITYVAGSAGNYVGVVDGAFNAATGAGYKLKLDANQGGVLAHWEIVVQVKQRSQ